MPLAAGTRLGPYEILDPLGAGGMGEVYRARDPRLGRDVAVKVLPEDLARDPERLQRFEREARAVAAVSHPNILTVFDVGTHEGVPYVVTELLEGETLRELLSRRAPTQRQVLFFLAQAAHGLEAAHAKGIVHRDVKPENLFVTSDGRVKLLDFGLAKQLTGPAGGSGEATESSPTGAGQVLGTVAYMSPEQVRGLPLDHRTDLFSFGVVAYELLSGKHPFRRETTVATLTAILEDAPAELVGLGRGVPPAVSGIVQRCLAKGREERFRSAHDLALSLESVLSAPAGAASLDEVEIQSPYPGLASFTEKEAGLFFGREAEVKALWGKLHARKLAAVIAPSGAGKTSLVRAGVVASRPEGWSTAVCTPGASPFRGLGRALAGVLSGDAEALGKLVDIDDPAVAFEVASRWRRGHGDALLVVDQFEELFTLNPKEAQSAFAALLGRLAREADVHVLLSMRDDFLIRCSEQEALAGVFLDLTPLPALSPEGLVRALVEPAKRRGYRFEDDALVGEMVESVEGARGALPLLAFAVSRLWEKRDRERKLLTRAAYEEVGGVAGALAQHAEATMDRIGPERQALVREVFRNLVTAQGTRAVAEREELLSAFPDRKAAEAVLRELIDARLLTSYEVSHSEGAPGGAPEESAVAAPASRGTAHRVEVAHESLLKAWPRLVRWQAQDEEGAVLRDQLRQAAHLWEEKGRTSDLLWSGTAFQEFELWRGRYQGRLTALEEAFARAMREKARRRRRLVTATVAAVIVALAGVAIAIGVSRQQAVAAPSRAEAARLVALGRVELDRYPTAALAYARKSLETADNAEARRLAVEALWRGPTARAVNLPSPSWRAAFSPDGRQLAAYTFSEYIQLFAAAGGAPRLLGGFLQPAGPPLIGFSPGGDTLVAGWWDTVPGRGVLLRTREVSLPDGRERRWVETREPVTGRSGWTSRPEGMLLFNEEGPLFSWDLVPWDGGERRVLGSARRVDDWTLGGDRLFLLRGRTVVTRPLEGPATTPERVVGTVPEGKPLDLRASPRGEPVVVLEDETGPFLALLPSGATRPRIFRIAAPDPQFPPAFDADGRRLAWGSSANGSVAVWDLDGPPDVEPLVLKRPSNAKQGLFSPGGDWLAVPSHVSLAFWPLTRPTGRVLRRHAGSGVLALRFAPDSATLASCAADGLGLWPMTSRGQAGEIRREVGFCEGLAFSADGRQKAWVNVTDVRLDPGAGREPRLLFHQDYPVETNPWGAAFDGTGRKLAVGAAYARRAEDMVLRVFDLATGATRRFPLVPPGEVFKGYEWNTEGGLVFAADGSLLASGMGGIRRFDVETGRWEWLRKADASTTVVFSLAPDGRTAVVVDQPYDSTGRVVGRLAVLDIATRSERAVPSHGQRLSSVAVSPSGREIVTGDAEGIVRVGPIDGGEPHLLMGHAGPVGAITVSPDGRWIASASGNEIRLWPMPDVSKPPFHTLPYAELIARLDALTNLRAVEDHAAAAGYSLELAPFPGWSDTPTW